MPTSGHHNNANIRTDAVRSGFVAFAQSIASPQLLLSNLTAATIIAILNITGALSVGALVFSGPLSSYLAMGIGLFLVGNAITALLVPISSEYKANIASIRTGQAPIFAAIAASIAVSMPNQSAEAMAVTAVVGILMATFLSGAVMFGLGWAKLGGMARYMPYPVLGGFFAGLGYLTGLGGLSVSVGPVADLGNLPSFAAGQALGLLGPAVAFALLLLVIERRIQHWLLVPIYLICSALAFYAVLVATGTSIEQATQAHWLPSLSGQGASFFPVIALDQLALVDWSAILSQSATFAVLALLSVIMLLLDVSGVELVINRDLDPNRELKAAGAANVFAAFGTGSLSFQSLTDVAFAHKLGGDRFLMILIYAAMTIAIIIAGPSPIGFVPNFILGGLLIYVGISMTIPWIWSARKKLPLSDYIVVWVILLVIAAYGILEGVGIGIALATILFAHRYSRLSIVKAVMTGCDYVTKTDRLPDDQAMLDREGAALRLFVLQGFLFFGSASRLLEQIKANLDAPAKTRARFLAVDFQRVDAMDTSATNSFAKLIQICRRDRITLALCGCSPEIATSLGGAVLDLKVAEGLVLFFADLEEGVEWCNDEILAGFDRNELAELQDPVTLLTNLLGNTAAAQIIADASEKIDAATGSVVFRQNDLGDALYLVLKGSVAILLDLPAGQTVMVRTMREGSIIGEMALYTGASRSATAKMREDGVLLRLDRAAFERLQLEHPGPFGKFHTYVIKLMADRIARANREVVALLK
jgi:SulP family sulfate permease